MENTIDLLQIKIEKAKAQLPETTRRAIDAVDWKGSIVGMRAKKGYTFEQLGDLELETELLLCGLLSTENYPKELESRMKITKAEADALANEMNDLVFKKIHEEFIKIIESNKIPIVKTPSLANQDNLQNVFPETQIPKHETDILKNAGIEVVERNEEINAPAKQPLLAQKLAGSFQIPTAKTDHSTENITKNNNANAGLAKSSTIDPYRELPE